MRKASSLFLAATLLSVPPAGSFGASSPTQSDLEKEYIQVRKIALKDSRVQDAFAKANARLDARILEIDPALKPIIDRQSRIPAPVAAGTPQPKIASRAAVASASPERQEHTVIKGETLSSIAEHYHVRVATLEKANHITDDRKLQVGQKLLVPAADRIETQPAAESQETPAKENGGLWDRLKDNL